MRITYDFVVLLHSTYLLKFVFLHPLYVKDLLWRQKSNKNFQLIFDKVQILKFVCNFCILIKSAWKCTWVIYFNVLLIKLEFFYADGTNWGESLAKKRTKKARKEESLKLKWHSLSSLAV